MTKHPCVYILANHYHVTLYIGVTSNLVARVWQHKSDLVQGFSNDHAVHFLVWFELHETMESAILKEKQIKKWNRRWKLRLIKKMNPEWEDLSKDFHL